jgi:hypothetical protein
MPIVKTLTLLVPKNGDEGEQVYSYLVNNGKHVVHFKDQAGAILYRNLLEANGNEISDEELFLGHGDKYYVLGEIEGDNSLYFDLL